MELNEPPVEEVTIDKNPESEEMVVSKLPAVDPTHPGGEKTMHSGHPLPLAQVKNPPQGFSSHLAHAHIHTS